MRLLLAASLLVGSASPGFSQARLLEIPVPLPGEAVFSPLTTSVPRDLAVAAPQPLAEKLEQSLRAAPEERGSRLDVYFDSTRLSRSAAEAPLSEVLVADAPAPRFSRSAPSPRLPGLRAAPENVRPRSPLVTTLRLWIVAPLVALTLPLGRLESFFRLRPMRLLYPGAKTLGGGHSNVVLLAKGPDGEKRIVKRYGLAGTALAHLSRFTLPMPLPMGTSRKQRFDDDREAFADFERAGIPASRMLSSDPKTLTNVSSFVEGRPLVSLIKDETAMAGSASSLRRAHDRGWAIIDNQPSNFVIGADGRAYFIDLEHAHRDPEGRFRAWDVAVYLTWLHAGLDDAAAAKAETAFWAGYGPVAPDTAKAVAAIRESLRPFFPAMKVSSMDSEASSG